MSLSRILGIILFAVGLVLLVFAWNSSHALPDKLTAAATGKFTKGTIWYIITGIAAVLGGAGLFIGGRPKP